MGTLSGSPDAAAGPRGRTGPGVSRRLRTAVVGHGTADPLVAPAVVE